MKRVVGPLFILSGTLWVEAALAQGANTAPPTAQFPSMEPAPAQAPATPELPAKAPNPAPPLRPVPTAPPAAAPTPAAAPPPPSAYPAYPYPPPYPYGYPALVPLTPTKPPATDSEEVFTITLAPLLLIGPIVQLTGELRATPHFGISAIVGYGSIAVDGSSNATASAYELGARAVGYPLKKFKSLQLGAQLLYLKVDSNDAATGTTLSDNAAGVAFGPFAGYKLVTDIGFTFVGQLGVQYLSAQAEAHDDAGNVATSKDNRFLPLANAEIGWSF
jgi:hypothetical protein